MALFKPWTWFQSEERQLRITNLNLEKKERELKIKLLEKQLNEQKESLPAETVRADKPYRSLRLTGETCIVVLHDGTMLTEEGGKAIHIFTKIKEAQTEKEIIALFAPPEEVKETVEVETKEEVAMVKSARSILHDHPDFELEEDKTYLKGVKLAMPAVVTGSFIEILEKAQTTEDVKEYDKLEEMYESLKMFWYWTALNPIESSRNALLNFIRKQDVKITKNGLLEMYRRVVTNTHQDTTLVDAISNHYAQIKKWKKSPHNYQLFKCKNAIEEDYTYVVGTSIADGKVQKYNTQELVGNLQELYNDLPNMKENSYTDNHTKKMVIRVGSVYQESEDKIDLDNLKDCSSGLHVGSRSFMFDSFGDTGVLALVNPAKVRSVPYSETNKMRVSEMFIAAVMPETDFRKSVDEEDIADYSQEYFNHSVEELQEALAEKTFEEEWTVQGHKPAVPEVEVAKIKDLLAAKVVEFS